MTHQQYYDAGVPAEAPAEAKGGMSRRKLIATGAALAVAGGAVGAAGTFAVSQIGDSAGSVAKPEGEVMLYLKNAQSGELDLFVNEHRTSFVDKTMAAALAKAANDANDATAAE